MQVDASRIEAKCKVKLKLNAATVLDPEAPQALIAVLRQLQHNQVPVLALAILANLSGNI